LTDNIKASPEKDAKFIPYLDKLAARIPPGLQFSNAEPVVNKFSFMLKNPRKYG
jgi:hypothetical protein